MKFINRRRELDYLETEYARNGSSFVVIFGRRRLGKTTLIKEYIKDKPGAVYFLADKSSESVSINLFKDVIDRSNKNTGFSGLFFSTWDQLFAHFLRERAGGVKQILVIDEFQYLVWSNKAFPSILQRIWDQHLMNANIMLIVCGSSVSMMLSEVLNYSSPLYGRRTGQIQLEPIDFCSFQEFLPSLSPTKLAEIYGITGGVPKYIGFFNDNKPLITKITDTYLNVDHFMNQEARFILSEDVNEPLNYFSILKSIAAGNHTISGISNDLKFPLQKISPYIHTLQQLGLVKRIVPITETAPHKSKKGLYQIGDYYLRFWFRFVFPYQSEIALGNTEWLANMIQTEYSHYMGAVFEDICRQQVGRLFPGSFPRIGSWWDKHNEIDVVAINQDNKSVLLGECKWSNKTVGKDILEHLKERSTKIDFGFHPSLKIFVIFSKSGFTSELMHCISETIILLDMSDFTLRENNKT